MRSPRPLFSISFSRASSSGKIRGACRRCPSSPACHPAKRSRTSTGPFSNVSCTAAKVTRTVGKHLGEDRLWRQTMLGISWPTRVLTTLALLLILAVLFLVAVRLGSPPTAQTDVCSHGYARARNAAESTVVDAHALSSSRIPGRWTCGDERRYLDRRRADALQQRP